MIGILSYFLTEKCSGFFHQGQISFLRGRGWHKRQEGAEYLIITKERD